MSNQSCIDNGSILISNWHWSRLHFPPRYLKSCQTPTSICVILYSQNPQGTTRWNSTTVCFIFGLLFYRYHYSHVFNFETIDAIYTYTSECHCIKDNVKNGLNLRDKFGRIYLASILFIRCNQSTQNDGDNVIHWSKKLNSRDRQEVIDKIFQYNQHRHKHEKIW